MQAEGITPSIATYVCVLKACGNIGAIHNGIRLHFEIVHKGMEGDQSICNSLLCMYIKCGLLSRARELFLTTCFPQNIVSWSVMIQGYGAHHDSHMVLSCFEEMQRQGIRPNAITFTCLLDACSHANLIAPAWVYFKSMEDEYGISPTMEHYTCVVDVLARSGHLHDAMKFLEMFQHSASERTWAALLSACKAHCQTSIGSKCFEHIMLAESVVRK
jgi:pentatricopeptide repeat protein